MNQLMQQAQRVQREMEKAQEEIAAMTVTAAAGGSAVEVTIDGSHKITQLTIDPKVVDPDDIEMLQDLITVAVNDAQQRFAEQSDERMARVTGGKGLPFSF